MNTQLVKDGYDKVANIYLANRDRLKSGKYVQQLLKLLPKKSSILDLGCGAGVPVDDILIKAGHFVTGIDISSEQIKLARKKCRGGEFIVRDIQELQQKEFNFDAVVSFYTLFHIPKNDHQQILRTIASYLTIGGIILITMGDREFEGQHALHDIPMWSSQFGTEKNIELVKKAGFKILSNEIDTSGGERHLVILAQKI